MLITEHLRSLEPKVDFFLAGGTDFLRADPDFDGGITGAMKIAAAAEGLGTDVEIHFAGPAHRHCMSAIRNTNYYEMGLLHPNFDLTSPASGVSENYADGLEAIDADGCVMAPDGPGLGVVYDWDKIRAHQISAFRTADHAVARRSPASAIWSLCVSNADLVTLVLDIENHSDQIDVGTIRSRSTSGTPTARGRTAGSRTGTSACTPTGRRPLLEVDTNDVVRVRGRARGRRLVLGLLRGGVEVPIDAGRNLHRRVHGSGRAIDPIARHELGASGPLEPDHRHRRGERSAEQGQCSTAPPS